MPYLLDSNGFIQAENQYYSRDFCPAYWDWLLANALTGRVISIDRVYNEIQAQQDNLAQWASQQDVRALFLPINDATVTAFQRVAAWVRSRRQDDGSSFYGNAAQSDFLGGGADPYLIAYALAHAHTVVTCEGKDPARRNKVLIPVVCEGLGVECISLFEMLRREYARFILG